MINEDQLLRWAQAPSEAEEIKCQRTRSRIEEAINARFGSRVTVYYQGSYSNRTNVRFESDVDIIAEYKLAYYPGLYFLTPEQVQEYYARYHTPHPYTQPQFRADIVSILTDAFGEQVVDQHEKCIKILKDSNRVNADVIPCFTHRRFVSSSVYDETSDGIHFFTRSGQEVISYPKQHLQNGERKNTDTNGKYKDTVRILKNIRYKLIDNRLIAPELLDSHLVECVIYNTPNPFFGLNTRYDEILKNILEKVYQDMNNQVVSSQYKKVHERNLLFGEGYTQAQVSAFVIAAWNIMGYNNGS